MNSTLVSGIRLVNSIFGFKKFVYLKLGLALTKRFCVAKIGFGLKLTLLIKFKRGGNDKKGVIIKTLCI